MTDGRLTTYAAFAAAILAVGALGITYGKSTSPTPDTAVDLAMPEMTPVASAGGSAVGMDKEAIRAEIRDYILEEPEIILEAFRLLEEKRVVDEAQADIDLVRANSKELFDDGYSFVGGNPEGSITVVEFQDYRCGYCKRAHGEVQDLIREDGDIRLVVKEFPILGPDSTKASELAIATLISQGDAAYERFSHALMTFDGPVTEQTIGRIAQGALVDIAQSQAALSNPEVRQRIAKTHALGSAMKITGTPTFIIGEKVIRGYLPKEQMAEVVSLSRSVAQ